MSTMYEGALTLEECIEILKKYKNELTAEQYDTIDSSIRSMYLSYCPVTEAAVLGLIELGQGKVSLEEANTKAIARIKAKYGEY